MSQKAGELKDKAAEALDTRSAGDKAHDAKEHAKSAARDAGDAVSQKASEAKHAASREADKQRY